MFRSIRSLSVVALLSSSAFVIGGCSESAPSTGTTANNAGVGSVDIAVVQGGVTLTSVGYTISGPNSFSSTGTINVAASSTISAVIGGLPAGNGYTIMLTATGTDGVSTCGGSGTFNVTAGAVATVAVTLDCHQPAKTGSVAVNGTINVCPVADGLSANPSDVAVGFPVALALAAHDPDNGPSPLAYAWSAPSGSFTGATTATPTFICTAPGPVTLTATASDGDATAGCAATMTVVVTCEPGTLLVPKSLVISSTTYDRTQGAIASLTVGTTQLAGTNTATVAATASNNYLTVWNNEIGRRQLRRDLADPADRRRCDQLRRPQQGHRPHQSGGHQLPVEVGGRSSRHHRRGRAAPGVRGYAGAGVGALDVSNSDAVAGQDPTNPVSFAFGASYAFPRTIVSMDGGGHFSYTPTINYGGNNGRSALLGSNGLYYSVGNANNGNATAFGAANGTNPDVTETTGLEVVTPINAATSNVAIPAGNSSEVNPLIQYSFGSPPKPDKPGKDNNYRGVTEFGGALYFTKGSGSNGMQTVYTVASLPTVADAAAATISVVPGFPTDSAKATGGNFTPFAVFFANATTMYVSDEGSGNATDTSTHAGLEKWSLVSGTWQLDYVLTQGLIGVVDSGLTGPDGTYPNVTTVGLRNLTGVVNGDQVTLWATTSTSSTSGDNGADPEQGRRDHRPALRHDGGRGGG